MDVVCMRQSSEVKPTDTEATGTGEGGEGPSPEGTRLERVLSLGGQHDESERGQM